ncbi:porin [Novipirellula artificiosorum]
MKQNYLALLAMLCAGTGFAAEGQNVYDVGDANTANPIAQVGYLEVGESVCGCAGACNCGVADTSFGTGCMEGCEVGCEDDCGSIFDSACECNLGDPCMLFGECGNFSVGGWVSVGYNNKSLPLFNNRANEAQVHQAWLYAEKAIDTSCGFDIGGRIDYLYGTDGPDTQAFGIDNNHWDNQWDNGPDYGHAIPQLYMEAGYGDWSVKAGHFYTIIGWEVVQATGNFFYSHAYTMYNSEPFTHTGALATYSGMEKLELFGGYVLGWDSGFEDNGDAFLGGASLSLNDDVTLTYSAVGGVFANNLDAFEQGYMHSVVADIALTDKLQYVFQTDLLTSDDRDEQTVRDTFGINQYLIREINDCISIGARMEWWQVQADSRGYADPDAANPADAAAIVAAGYDPASEDFDVYALTLGVNVRPHANVVVRPEIRYDWVYGNRDWLAAIGDPLLQDNANTQTTFGIDTVITY